MNPCEHKWIGSTCSECGIPWYIWANQELKRLQGLIKRVHDELNFSFELSEQQYASEKLAGNSVKISYWKGELAVLHRVRRALESPSEENLTKEDVLEQDSQDSSLPFREALKLLTKAVEERYSTRDLSICWGNGISIRSGNNFLRGGIPRIADMLSGKENPYA